MHFTGTGGFDNSQHGKRGMGMGWFEEGRGIMTQLTDAEKAKLATMTPAEKKTFFEAKMTEQKALRDAKEAVIDKLINGESLTDAEKATLETIKTERAAMKAARAAREAKIAEIKPILDKVKTGTVLTTDEQAKLDAFRATMRQGGKEGHEGKMRGMGR